MDQSPSASALESMKPFLNAIVKPELLKNQYRDVKVLVATCVCEITRITAPEAPYSDDVLKDIFQLIVSTFSGLNDMSSLFFGQEVAMLETLAKYRPCVVVLDLECDDLVNEMFSTFFTVASSVDLMLERLCLEGSRRQTKYVVHALAAITKDDGLKSLSVLYKRLVDMLEEKTNQPTILQSLGCIAQTAIPVFETRESEIEEFIINKILKK